MQDNTYRYLLIEGLEQIQMVIFHYFACAMDIAALDEMEGVIEPGEVYDLPVDILLTMRDPVVKHIGESLLRVVDIGNTIVNLNNLQDDEIWETPSVETQREAIAKGDAIIGNIPDKKNLLYKNTGDDD